MYNIKDVFQPRIIECLKNYGNQQFTADMMAGVIVGIVAIPLAIAFGIASGVGPTEGLITAFLLFCMGSMSIIGPIEEGLTGEISDLLLTKSMMDGFSAFMLSSTFGFGVVFSAIPLLIYQGGITIFADFIGNSIEDDTIKNLTAVGGILLIGLGINILNIKHLRIINLLPALIFICIFMCILHII